MRTSATWSEILTSYVRERGYPVCTIRQAWDSEDAPEAIMPIMYAAPGPKSRHLTRSSFAMELAILACDPFQRA
jgi:hypothetical protein